MNPARSPQRTGCLPTSRQSATHVSATSAAVATVLTTSTSFMSGAGLKKCSPMTSWGREVTTAMSITGRLDVVVARIAPGRQMRSSSTNSAVLTSMSSTTASTTRSTSARSLMELLPRTRASAASRSSDESLPLSTALAERRLDPRQRNRGPVIRAGDEDRRRARP